VATLWAGGSRRILWFSPRSRPSRHSLQWRRSVIRGARTPFITDSRAAVVLTADGDDDHNNSTSDAQLLSWSPPDNRRSAIVFFLKNRFSFSARQESYDRFFFSLSSLRILLLTILLLKIIWDRARLLCALSAGHAHDPRESIRRPRDSATEESRDHHIGECVIVCVLGRFVYVTAARGRSLWAAAAGLPWRSTVAQRRTQNEGGGVVFIKKTTSY